MESKSFFYFVSRLVSQDSALIVKFDTSIIVSQEFLKISLLK